MQPDFTRKLLPLLPAATLFATVVIGIYMARPWGDNYAYQSVWGYVGLFMFLGWACLPYIFLFSMSKASRPARAVNVTRLVETCIVCVGGLYILIDTAFFNIDAQGALIFVFLPVYQWLVVGVFETIGYVMKNYSS